MRKFQRSHERFVFTAVFLALLSSSPAWSSDADETGVKCIFSTTAMHDKEKLIRERLGKIKGRLLSLCRTKHAPVISVELAFDPQTSTNEKAYDLLYHDIFEILKEPYKIIDSYDNFSVNISMKNGVLKQH